MTASARYRFTAELWEHPGPAPWCFVTLPAEASEDIAEGIDRSRPGFGSVRVTVSVGATTWRTSLFPDSARGAYLLPVKRDVRRREGLEPGDVCEVTVEVAERPRPLSGEAARTRR